MLKKWTIMIMQESFKFSVEKSKTKILEIKKMKSINKLLKDLILLLTLDQNQMMLSENLEILLNLKCLKMLMIN